jgi:hypothetical protein
VRPSRSDLRRPFFGENLIVIDQPVNGLAGLYGSSVEFDVRFAALYGRSAGFCGRSAGLYGWSVEGRKWLFFAKNKDFEFLVR